MCGDGCDGGYPIRAWKYFVQHGVVTEEVSVDSLACWLSFPPYECFPVSAVIILVLHLQFLFSPLLFRSMR